MRQITDRHQRVRAVFDEALPQAAAAREAYLDRACAGDPEFRSDVMRLLEAQQETRTLLERSARHSALSSAAAAGRRRHGRGL